MGILEFEKEEEKCFRGEVQEKGHREGKTGSKEKSERKSKKQV